MIVMDCSAAVNIAFETEEGNALAALMLDGERVAAPTLLYAEAANSVFKYARAGRISESQMEYLMNETIGIVDDFVDIECLWREVLPMSNRLNHPAYDLFYFVLARRNNATLFTLDRKLQKLCLEHGVQCIDVVDLP